MAADDSYVPEFDTPSGIAGTEFNMGIEGAYAHPAGGGPVIDTVEQRANQTSGTADLGHEFDPRAMDSDSFSASMPSQQVSSFGSGLSQLASNFQSGVENLSGLSAYQPASVPATPAQPGQPDTTAAPNPASFTPAQPAGAPGGPSPLPNYSQPSGLPDPAAPAMGPDGQPSAQPGQQPGQPQQASVGTLSATVPWADDSLAAAVASAAAGAGPHAALVSGTVSMSGGTVSVGGSTPVGSKGVAAQIMAAGSVGGSAPQFANDAHGWFADAVNNWIAANPPPPPPPPPQQQAPTPGAPAAPGTEPTSPAPPMDTSGLPMTGPPPMDPVPGIAGQMAGGPMDPSSPMYSGPYLGATQPATTNETVGSAVMGRVDGFLSSFDHPDAGFQDSFSEEPIWKDSLGANMTHEDVLNEQAKAFAQGGQGIFNRLAHGDIYAGYRPTGGMSLFGNPNPVTYDNPQDAQFVQNAISSMGGDPSSADIQTESQWDAEHGFGGEADDPVTGEPNYDPTDIWSSPLGGISNVETSAEEGELMPPTSSWTNRMMTL